MVIEFLRWTELTTTILVALAIIQFTVYAKWWRDPVSSWIIYQDVFLIFTFVPVLLSLFFNFNARNSQIAAWGYVAAISFVGLGMIGRLIIWYRIHRKSRDE
jgi:hypothetical protein